MLDHRTNEIVLRANRGLVAAWLALGVALIAAFSFFSYLTEPEVASLAIPLLVIAIPLLVITSTYIFAPLLRLFFTGNAIILTEQGLLCRVGDVDFVAWGEIRGADLQSSAGLLAIALDLRDPEAVLGRLSPSRRWILRCYMKRSGGKPMIYASFVQGGAEHLLQLIRERITRPGEASVVEPGASGRGGHAQRGRSALTSQIWSFVVLGVLLVTVGLVKIGVVKIGAAPETVGPVFTSVVFLWVAHRFWRNARGYANRLKRPGFGIFEVPRLLNVRRFGLVCQLWLARVLLVLCLLASGVLLLMAFLGVEALAELLSRYLA